MEFRDSHTIFRALSDPSRLIIINSLLQKPQYVEELAERLNLSVSTISFHLKKLEEASLLYKVKEQYYTILHINKEILQLSLKEMISFNNLQDTSQDERLKNYCLKVVRTYFVSGKLIRLPSQYKKKKIVLEAVLGLFEKERIYAEREVDEIINQFYEDHCTVRRFFIDENMMFRKRGKYTLNEKYNPESVLIHNIHNIIAGQGKKNIKMKNKEMNRTEIKKQYKQTLRPMGVYQLKDLKNNKIYIGSSKNLEGIFNRHRFELTTGMHQINEVQDVWNKYGEKGIKLEVLDKLEPKEDPAFDYAGELKVLQKLWIEKLSNEGLNVYGLNGTSLKSYRKTE